MCEQALRLVLGQQVSQRTGVASEGEYAKQGQALPVSLIPPGCSLSGVCRLPV